MPDATHEALDHHEGVGAGAGEESERDALVRAAVTVGVVGVAVALVEVALIPGMIIGVAAAAAPKYMPDIGKAVQPLFRSTVRGIYKANRKTRRAMAEAREKVGDIMAEVHSEATAPAPAKPTPAPTV